MMGAERVVKTYSYKGYRIAINPANTEAGRLTDAFSIHQMRAGTDRVMTIALRRTMQESKEFPDEGQARESAAAQAHAWIDQQPVLIEFPVGSVYDPGRNSVAFPVLIQGNQHRCLVTDEALQDHFRANGARKPDEFVQAFEQNRHAIQAVAERRIRNGIRDEILLRSFDF